MSHGSSSAKVTITEVINFPPGFKPESPRDIAHATNSTKFLSTGHFIKKEKIIASGTFGSGIEGKDACIYIVTNEYRFYITSRRTFRSREEAASAINLAEDLLKVQPNK